MYIEASEGSRRGAARGAASAACAPCAPCAHHTFNVSILVNHVPVSYGVQCFCDLCVLFVPPGVAFRVPTTVVATEDNKVTVSLCCETCEHSSSFLALTHDITYYLSNLLEFKPLYVRHLSSIFFFIVLITSFF